jgi:hypothetical protein
MGVAPATKSIPRVRVRVEVRVRVRVRVRAGVRRPPQLNPIVIPA